MGRPRGVKETKPRNTVAKKVAAVAAENGITPLDVMLTAMREDWTAAQQMLADAKPADPAEAERWTNRVLALRNAAVATADKAAPYLHARLTSNDTTVHSDNIHRVVSEAPVTEEDWMAAHATPANDTATSDDRAAG
jgi:hypothetical protein